MVKVLCGERNREYFYGQSIDCDNYDPVEGAPRGKKRKRRTRKEATEINEIKEVKEEKKSGEKE